MRCKDKKKYYYVYVIVNSVNGKYYGGAHSTDDLNDDYMGSGTRLKAAIQKYGIEKFEKKIIQYFNTEDEMYAYEAEMVTQEWVDDPMCYNLKLGGENSGGMYGKRHTEESKKKNSESHKGRTLSPESIEKLRQSMKGKNKGKVRSEEWRKNHSKKMKGKRHPSPCKGKHWRVDKETGKRVYY